MFDHVTIRVSDLDTSRRFYDLALAQLGYPAAVTAPLFSEWEDFSISQAGDERPLTRNLHVAFLARSRPDIDEWWRRLTGAGYRDDGPPGLRPQYTPDYYGAFVLDPDGNSVEAVTFDREKSGDNRIDHLWIGVGDLAAQRRFWDTVAPLVDVRVGWERLERFHVAGRDRSFALVHDGRPPTENLHLAFPVGDNAQVDEFHRVMTAAGFTDDGPPGERPVYHAGYYGAYVLDPDGNNVEAVCHNRSSGGRG